MPRSRWMIGSIGFCLAAGACSAPGVAAGDPLAAHPAEARVPQRLDSGVGDSSATLALCNGQGPSVQITAKFWSVSGTRQAVADFHANDDAYVLIGHIDANGAMRIVYPAKPSDTGFVRGQTSYRTPVFFAGLAGEYEYERRTEHAFLPANPIAWYDRGFAYQTGLSPTGCPAHQA